MYASHRGRTVAVGVGIVVAAGLAVPVLAPGTAAATTAEPQLSVAKAQTFATPEGSTMYFTVRLSAKSSQKVTVRFATRNGSAVAGTDYVRTTGTLTFCPGATTEEVKVELRAVRIDDWLRAQSTFAVVLSDPVHAKLAAASTATGTILADTWSVPSRSTYNDAVINPSSTMAYLSGQELNNVDVVDLITGTLESPIHVGSRPMGLDITPDGKTLYVADSGAQTISKVDLASGAVSTINTPGIRPYSIVVLDNGYALFTSVTSSGHPYLLNLKTSAITEVTGIDTGSETEVSRSADHSTAAVFNEASRGPVYIYTAVTGKVVSTAYSGYAGFGVALDGDGSLLLVSGATVVNARTGATLGTITFPYSAAGAGVLTWSGTVGYTLNGAVCKLNVPGLKVSATYLTDYPEDGSALALLVISDNDRVVIAPNTDGIMIMHV